MTRSSDTQETTEFVEAGAQTEGENALQNETIEEQMARMTNLSYQLTHEEMDAVLKMFERPPQDKKTYENSFARRLCWTNHEHLIKYMLQLLEKHFGCSEFDCGSLR